MLGMEPTTPDKTLVPRDTPEPDPARKANVKRWEERVQNAKRFWKHSFQRMHEDMAFSAGKQWPGQIENDDRYVANVVLRHVQQRVGTVYGKNPKVIAKRKERLSSSVWDGTFQSLQAAMQGAQAGDPTAMMTVLDASQAKQEADMLDRVAKTLELLFKYNVDEQELPFKKAMKALVRKALTAGVAYVKLGFQRAMKLRPEIERQIADLSTQLATIQRLASEIADGEAQPDSADADQLKSLMAKLQADGQQIVREGLAFSYPDSTAIIPCPKTTNINGFIGSRWVAEEYMLTEDDIEDVYGVDVSKTQSTLAYKRLDDQGGFIPEAFTRSDMDNQPSIYRVWEIYSKSDGLVYVVCEGYPDFLQEPAEPDVWMERFYPWFVFAPNEVYSPHHVFPPGDVRLMRDMQLEHNRARQGLREHRRANRPKMAITTGLLDDEDKAKLQSHPANALLELNALQPGQRIEDVLQPVKMPPIDPALYDTSAVFEDVLRVVGTQEANLGGTSGGTATETSIAESSRMSTQSSTVDDLDEMLTEFARAAGQVLMLNVSEQIVKEIVGPGAVWPTLNKEQLAREIYLEVEAASTGRPNKAAEVQNATQLMPILLQVPGMSPEWIARELIRRMDDRLDLKDAFMAGMPSIASLNRTSGMGAPAAGQNDPAQQGDKGGDNAPRTEPPQNNVAARPQEAPPPQAVPGQTPGQMAA